MVAEEQLSFDVDPPAPERTYGCCGLPCGPLSAPRDAVYPHAPDCPNPNVGAWIHRETGWTIRRLRCVGKDGSCPSGGRFVAKAGVFDPDGGVCCLELDRVAS